MPSIAKKGNKSQSKREKGKKIIQPPEVKVVGTHV